MSLLKGQRLYENLLYAVMWAILFAAPLFSMFMEQNGPYDTYDWESVYSSWKTTALFLCIFVIHNMLLAPLLVYARKKWIYLPCCLLLILSFSFYQLEVKPHPVPPEMKQKFQERQGPEGPVTDIPHRPEFNGDDPGRPKPPGEHDPKVHPPRPFGGEDMVQILILMMLLALNVGAKYYFKSVQDQARLKEMERQNMEERLKYLKYQINPHFFMNTLNNIHALVEFDPAKAQEAIEILSGLMRYVLYESNRPFVPLEKEIAFVRNYVDIMRIRYEETVSIQVSMPYEVPDVTVPPMVFATFLENAFKHGISYERKSYVKLEIDADNGNVDFLCRNSIQPHDASKPGGVGLRNVRKRLDLLYGPDYALDISETGEDYNVKLRLPFTHGKKD